MKAFVLFFTPHFSIPILCLKIERSVPTTISEGILEQVRSPESLKQRNQTYTCGVIGDPGNDGLHFYRLRRDGVQWGNK